VQASTPAIKNQKIVITYFSIVDSPPNVWDNSLLEPSSGDELVITSISIENHGYNAFETNKEYFSAVVKGVPYKYDSERLANDLLPDTKIANAEKATGNMTFTLPDSTFGSDITLNYAGPGEYNIVWINQNLRL
jgi:hypothetical protein